MKKFEYAILYSTRLIGKISKEIEQKHYNAKSKTKAVDLMKKSLKKAGNDGWELISVIPTGDDHMMIFKREKLK